MTDEMCASNFLHFNIFIGNITLKIFIYSFIYFTVIGTLHKI